MSEPDADVVIVGAGLAGLAAAGDLRRRGLTVRVFEAADEVGGRVRTDHVDGFLLDRGFQVLLPAYPQVRRLVDLTALRPRGLGRGVIVATQDGHRVLAPPTTGATAGDLARQLVDTPADAAAVAAWSARDVLTPRKVRGMADRSIREDLRRWRVSDSTLTQVLRPFLASVFLDPTLSGSARLFHLVWRCFLLGGAVLPAEGIGALARQLATAVPPGTITLDHPVAELLSEGDRHGVLLADGRRVWARTVVVATDGTTAATLLPGLATPQWQSGVTCYFRAPIPLRSQPLLVVDGTGPQPCTMVALSAVAPEYAPPGQSLVAATLPGRTEYGPDDERWLRQRLAATYGTTTTQWDTVAVYPIANALPFTPPGQPLRRPVRCGPGRYVCGDHRDTASVQGALVSGRRAAAAVCHDLGVPAAGH